MQSKILVLVVVLLLETVLQAFIPSPLSSVASGRRYPPSSMSGPTSAPLRLLSEDELGEIMDAIEACTSSGCGIDEVGYVLGNATAYRKVLSRRLVTLDHSIKRLAEMKASFEKNPTHEVMNEGEMGKTVDAIARTFKIGSTDFDSAFPSLPEGVSPPPLTGEIRKGTKTGFWDYPDMTPYPKPSVDEDNRESKSKH